MQRYDLKHQIFTQISKSRIEIEPNSLDRTKIIILGHLLIDENDLILHIREWQKYVNL